MALDTKRHCCFVAVRGAMVVREWLEWDGLRGIVWIESLEVWWVWHGALWRCVGVWCLCAEQYTKLHKLTEMASVLTCCLCKRLPTPKV